MTAVLDTATTTTGAIPAPATGTVPEVWLDVCGADELIPDRGVCALVADRQVAIFQLSRPGGLYAVDNHDPFSRANVMSRGIVGSLGDVPKVASPMYKQTFDLRSGVCLDDPSVALQVYPVRERCGRVEVAVT